MAFPLYAMQKAVSDAGVLLLSTITALGPLVVFCLQMTEGRVAFSGFTLAGLPVYSLRALLAVSTLAGEHRDNSRKQCSPVSPSTSSNRYPGYTSMTIIPGAKTGWPDSTGPGNRRTGDPA